MFILATRLPIVFMPNSIALNNMDDYWNSIDAKILFSFVKSETANSVT